MKNILKTTITHSACYKYKYKFIENLYFSLIVFVDHFCFIKTSRFFNKISLYMIFFMNLNCQMIYWDLEKN